MKMSKPFRLIAALLALFSLLFAQMAVASYVCPGMPLGTAGGAVTLSIGSPPAEMSGCIGMDMAQPGLCQAYDQAGNQSLDKPEVPAVASFIPVELVVALHFPDVASPSAVTPSQSLPLTRATAPPIAIRHCCFRI